MSLTQREKQTAKTSTACLNVIGQPTSEQSDYCWVRKGNGRRVGEMYSPWHFETAANGNYCWQVLPITHECRFNAPDLILRWAPPTIVHSSSGGWQKGMMFGNNRIYSRGYIYQPGRACFFSQKAYFPQSLSASHVNNISCLKPSVRWIYFPWVNVSFGPLVAILH